jgi:hypothetical protein
LFIRTKRSLKNAGGAAFLRLRLGIKLRPFREKSKCELDRCSIALAAMERTQTEKFMPAGFTAQRGQPEKTPKG